MGFSFRGAPPPAGRTAAAWRRASGIAQNRPLSAAAVPWWCFLTCPGAALAAYAPPW